MPPIFINGRFLAKPVTGTERFAREIVWALDTYLRSHPSHPTFTLLAPPGTSCPEGLQRIGFAVTGKRGGHAWEQWDLFRASAQGVLLNLTNSGPVLHGNQWTVIHDAAVYRTPTNFSRKYGMAHRFLGRLLAHRSRIATVSEFSRQELAQCLHVNAREIPIFHNGHEHMLGAKADESVIATLKLSGRPFFLFVGSPTPNKNLLRAIEAFRGLAHPSLAFVLVGAAKSSLFQQHKAELPEGVIMPGRLSDGEIAALYRYARALVFPSLYEGFGIPPLEAMVHRCPVLASDIAPVREVCGDAALYFDGRDPASIRTVMQQCLDNPSLRESLIAHGNGRYPRFSWRGSAKELVRALGV